jgi:histidine triad (HIT) family protein
MASDIVDECFICRKHRGEIQFPGGSFYEDDLVYIGHAAIPEGESTTYLGAFLVEPRRHAPGIGDLTGPEAERVGLLASRLGRALVEAAGAEHVYLFVLGHHVDHLHLWVVARYPGTPREYWGQRVDEWPDAPRGGPEAIEDLCRRVGKNLGW